MNLSRVKNGDRIQVNIRGRVFDAKYVAKETVSGIVMIEPEHPAISYRTCTPRQVVRKLKK